MSGANFSVTSEGGVPTPTSATATVSYILLTALFFLCRLSIQRPVIGVTLCTG